MGERSECFEDIPEENPANYVGGRFDPNHCSCPVENRGLSPVLVSPVLPGFAVLPVLFYVPADRPKAALLSVG